MGACMDACLNACSMNHVLQYVRVFPSGWVHNTRSEGGGKKHDILRETEGNVTCDLREVVLDASKVGNFKHSNLSYLPSRELHAHTNHVVPGLLQSTLSIVHRPWGILGIEVWNFTT